MIVSMRPIGFVAFALSLAWPGVAPAQDGAAQEETTQRCIAAYESSQELKLDRKLIEAEEQLRICVATECPQVARQDCGRWLDEVQQATPSIVIRFIDASGAERNDVTVTTADGRSLAAQLDGKAIAINPGPQRLLLTPRGGAVVPHDITVAEGEKLRQVVVKLPGARESEATEGDSSIHPVAWVLYGLSAAGIGAFIGLGVHSLGLEDCKDTCNDEQVDDIVLFRALADVSLGVGVLALGGAIWVTVASVDDDGADHAQLDVAVMPVMGGAALGAALRF